MSYIPNFFKADELVGPEIYDQLGGNLNKICLLFDNRLLWTADQLRRKYGICIINDWQQGGNFSESGLRTFDTLTGAKWSQHKFARALDGKFKETDVNEIRKDILDDPFNDRFKYITCIEMKTSWLHWDTRNWNKKKNGILKIYP